MHEPEDPPEHRDATATPAADGGEVAVVDWARTGRRLRISASALLAAAVLTWLGAGLVRGRLAPSDLGDHVGFALAALFVIEVVVVGGSAVRGMLRAGERGHRLAGSDVGLLPPRWKCRRQP